MAWWSRRPPQHDESTSAKDEHLDQALEEADRALKKVRTQKAQQKTLGEILREIREQNHFAELFRDDGMTA